MLTNHIRLTVSVAAVSLLAACSTVVEGSSQQIVVNTTPAGANCDLIRDGASIGHVSSTPSSVKVDKSKRDITIECTLPEFHKATYYNKSDVAGATVGNVLIGGLIGWGIDSASGADNKYTSPVNITMVPLSEPAPAPISYREDDRRNAAEKPVLEPWVDHRVNH
jgi:hypothetical protein